MDLVLREVERANEGLGLRGARLKLALEGLRTPVYHKTVWVECRRIDEKEKTGTYTRTPLVNSFLGSWTTALMTTFSTSNTESTVEAKMNKMDWASCAPGHALRRR
jgi:hypothetical protein